jgi:thiosulfate reductase/polysulfide reductase chain A
VVQTGLCRQDEEIMVDLARRLDLPESHQSLEDINFRLEPLDLTFEELKNNIDVYPSHEYRKSEKNGFRTPSKKVELYSRPFERQGYNPLPGYQEPVESPVSQPGLSREFPYVLTTGSRRVEFFHSKHRQIRSLRKRKPDPTAEMNPATASRHGVADGDWVTVSSPRGQLPMKAAVTDDIRTGAISIDHGWWFPERDGPDFGVWACNANLLTSNPPLYDPAFGSYQLRGLLCNIDKMKVDP